MKILRSFIIIFALCFSSCYGSTFSEVYVQADKAQLFCRVFGKGDPIVVIHGGAGLTQDYLLPAMAKLGENNMVIFYDQRGCGLSSGEINADSMQTRVFLEDLESIRGAFCLKKMTVLGHSWGGYLAMQYAIAYPESTDKLILLNSMPASSDEFSSFVEEFLRRAAPYWDELEAIKESEPFKKRDPATIEKYHRIMFRFYCMDPHKADLLNLYMSPQACINCFRVNELLEKNLFSTQFNFHDQLKKLNIPTLIVHGEFDIIPIRSSQKLHESIRNSQYTLIRNCGHFPYVEEPDQLFNCIKIFLYKN